MTQDSEFPTSKTITLPSQTHAEDANGNTVAKAPQPKEISEAATQSEVVVEEITTPQIQNTDPRRRLRVLLTVPERERLDAQWDEIAELEIQLAPGNRINPTNNSYSGTTGSGASTIRTAGGKKFYKGPGQRMKRNRSASNKSNSSSG